MYDVAALGELLIDFTCLSTDADGYPTMAAHPGGAPANYLAALTKFGAKTAMIGKVGNDAFGRLLIKTLKGAGIDTRGMLVSDDVFTTLAFVTLDDSGNREFSFARKPGADTQLRFDEIDLGVIDASKVLHFGTLSMTNEPARDATYKAVEYAAGHGKLISFDPNLRKPLWDDLDEAKRQMLWGLKHADIVKISDEETEFLFGIAPEEAAKHIIDSFGVRLVYVTCGAEGCFYRTKTASGFVKALSGIAVKDTTGAGDIFGGSSMYGLLKAGGVPEKLTAEELKEIVSFACASAGLSTTRAGGISSVAELIEVEAAMK
mgnify:CR=1 FL=1